MKVYRHLLLIVLLCYSLHQISAQNSPDSVNFSDWSYRKDQFKKSLYFTAPLIATGLFYRFYNNGELNKEVAEERNEYIANFSNHFDNYGRWMPFGTILMADLLSNDNKSNYTNQIIILIKSELIVTALVRPLKTFTHEVRPSNTNDESFPSGHTAQAFLGATFLHKEFGHKSIWYTISGYTVATSVGVLRVMNNNHYVGDVLVGAGIGILSTNLAYLSHQYKFGKKNKIKLSYSPTYNESNLGVYFSASF